eukprot:gene4778-3424_t
MLHLERHHATQQRRRRERVSQTKADADEDEAGEEDVLPQAEGEAEALDVLR